MNVVETMQALADEWHYGVERKGKGHVPYIEHPCAVVAQLKAWGMTEGANPVPLAVAWGHDLVEDTRVPAIAILNAAGEHGREVFDGIAHDIGGVANLIESRHDVLHRVLGDAVIRVEEQHVTISSKLQASVPCA